MGQAPHAPMLYQQNELWGLTKEKPITPAVYDTLIAIENPLFYIAKKHNASTGINSMGVISNKGKTIIPLNYLQIIPASKNYIVKKWINREVVYGVLSQSNNIILNVRYQNVQSFGKNWIANSADKMHLYNNKGVLLKEIIADSISSSSYANYVYTYKNGKTGLINTGGSVIYPPIYKSILYINKEWVASNLPQWQIISNIDTVLVFADSLKIWNRKTNIIGINSRYQVITKSEAKGKPYDAINIVAFSFAITTKSNLYGALHINGSEILPPSYRKLYYQNGFFYGYKNQHWAVFDSLGKKKSVFKYDSIGTIQNGLFPIKRKGKWGFMNRNGKEVIHCIYDSQANFKDGKAIINYYGAQGIINLQGDWLVKPMHIQITDFSYNFYISTLNEVFYLKNYEGKLIYFSSYELVFKNETIYEIRPNTKNEISSLGAIIKNKNSILKGNASWTLIKVGNKYGFEDSNGKLKITYRYDSLLPFTEGLAAFKLRGKWGFINTEEEIIIQPFYTKVTPFKNGLSVVSLKRKKGLIGINGNQILKPKYDSIKLLQNDVWVVTENGLVGLFNSEGHIIIQPKYNSLNYITDDLIILYKNGKYGAVNIKGESIIPRVYDFIGYDISNKLLILKRKI